MHTYDEVFFMNISAHKEFYPGTKTSLDFFFLHFCIRFMVSKIIIIITKFLAQDNDFPAF